MASMIGREELDVAGGMFRHKRPDPLLKDGFNDW
jgi:hypothetical protein